MAELSVDFTNDQSRFEAVIFQRDRAVLDGELNDLQRVARVRAYRSAMTMDGDDAKRVSQWGRCRVSNIEIVPGANPDEIDIQPVTVAGAAFGIISFRGYTFELTARVTLSGLAAAGGAAEYQQIYFTLAEEEISAADDPTIVVDKLGETARRTRLVVTFALGAVNTNTAGGLHTLEEPWEGGTKACVLGVILRDALAALPVTAVQIQPLWRPTNLVSRFQDRNAFLGPTNPETEALVSWVSTSSQLSFDNVSLYFPGQVGSEATPKLLARRIASAAITVTDGQAVWLVAERGQHGLGAASPGPSYGYDATWPPSTTNVGRILVEACSNIDQNVLATLDDDNLEERFLLCFRDGDTLIFRDGSVLGAGGAVSGADQAHVKHIGGQWSLDIPQLIDLATSVDNNELPSLRERYVATAGSMKLLFEAHGPDAGGGVQMTRLYSVNALSGFTGFMLTHNARWDDGDWDADDPAVGSAAMRIGGNTIGGSGEWSVSMRSGGTAVPWTDTAWIVGANPLAYVLRCYAGALYGVDDVVSTISEFRTLGLTGTSDPAPNAEVSPNTLYAANILKAWATISVAGGVVTHLDSFGLEIDPTITAPYVEFTLDEAMANDYYAVVVTSNADEYCYRVQRVAGGLIFRVTGYNPAGAGAALDYSADSDSFSVIVIGRHA